MQTAYPIKRGLGGKRGRMLMISNKKFKNPLNNREGAEVDENNLRELFTLFNYEVVLYRDKTVEVC